MLHKENEKKMWMLSGCFEKQQEQPDLQPSNTGLNLKWTYKKTRGKCELGVFPPIGLDWIHWATQRVVSLEVGGIV